MSTYVIGDIHGCYDDMKGLLHQIKAGEKDTVIFLGDYIDRGDQNLEMLRFIENVPENYILLRGNHEEEFIAYVSLLKLIDSKCEAGTDPDSNEDMAALYGTAKHVIQKKLLEFFDAYGTIGWLIKEDGVTLSDLERWSEVMDKMPYYHRFTCNGRDCIAVHAGYAANLNEDEKQHFFLYAREESLKDGIPGGMIIAGHTPTVLKGEFAYNHGDVFRYYDRERDCIFYDIDCGCVMREEYETGKLACLRVEDEKIFYWR